MKRFLAGLFISFSLFGQNIGQNVIVSNILPALTITGTVTTNYLCSTSSCPQGRNARVIQNIGQSAHQLKLVFTSVTGSSGTGSAEIDGSLDGTTWFQLGAPIGFGITSGLTSQAQTFQGFGSYPYLRTNITLHSATPDHFVVNADYIGNAVPTAIQVDMFGATTQMLTTCTNTGSVHCDRFTNNAIFVDTTAGPGGSAKQVTLYGINLNFPATTTGYQLKCGSSTTNDGTVIELENIAASIHDYIIPVGIRPLFQCPVGDSLSVLYSDSGAGVLYSTLFYRLE